MKSDLIRIVAVVVMLCISGCATGFRGAAKLPFDKKAIYEEFKVDVELNELATDPNLGESRRNAIVVKVTAAIDLRYSEFKHDFVANKKHSSSIADALTLMMTIAGSLTGSAGVKDNYLAGIALVTGSQSVYDKNYLFSQTISALIAQMDSNRKQKLVEITEAMKKDIDMYPPIAAFNDVIDYYHAGSVMGALMSIQRDAKTKEDSATKQLQSANSPFTPSPSLKTD